MEGGWWHRAFGGRGCCFVLEDDTSKAGGGGWCTPPSLEQGWGGGGGAPPPSLIEDGRQNTLVYQHLSHESQLLRCQQVCQKDVNYTIVCHHFPYETVATVAIWPAKAVATSEVLAAHTVLSVNGLRSTTACSSTLRYGPSRLNKGILHGHFHREHADENVIKDDMSLVNPCCVSQKEHSRIAGVIPILW